ncbi:MAG: hypothetical protein ACK5O9_03475 [Holosporales bacterium]|jgi:hypothetical protein
MNAYFSTDDAVREYLPLMHELAIRIELVAQAFEGKLNLPPLYAREYAYLQFRYICELIALGCLQLHGDLPIASSGKAIKEWNAEKIMTQLHNDNPHAFPQSAIREKTSILVNQKPNALTREDFKVLYNECGDVLHKGTIRKAKASFLESKHNYNQIIDWQNKIVNLMNEHFISRAEGKGFYIISLRTTSGYPECIIYTPNPQGGLNAEIRKMNLINNYEN